MKQGKQGISSRGKEIKLKRGTRLPALMGTAYHEAGHAVVLFYFGLPVSEVSIIQKRDSLGRVAHPSPMMLDISAAVARERRRAAREMILACYAGLQAERLFNPAASAQQSQVDEDNAFYLSREYGVFPRYCSYVGDELLEGGREVEDDTYRRRHKIDPASIEAGVFMRDLTDAEVIAHLLSNQGVALSRLGKLDEAIARYDAVLALHPTLVVAHYNRGLDLMNAGRLLEALASFDRASSCILPIPRPTAIVG